MLRNVFLTALSLALLSSSASAQCWECCNALHTITGTSTGERSGWYVNNAGDTDGDGIDDFLLGAPFWGMNNQGRVYLHSGATGALLHTFEGSPYELTGQCSAGVGDLDGDGHADVLIGGPAGGNPAIPGKVYVYSGFDGSLIRTHAGMNGSDSMGQQVEGLPDIDGDGVADYIIGALFGDFGGTNTGYARVISGATGASIRLHVGATPGANLGGGIGGHLGDVNGDQVADYLLASSGGGSQGKGQVDVISGATGGILYTVEGDALGVSFGWYFTNGTGDLNGDGVGDFFASDVYHQEQGVNTGKVYVFSGVDGAPLYELGGDIAGANFGVGHPVLPDLDGDGVNELFFGAWADSTGAGTGGAATLFSGASGESMGRWTGSVAGALFAGDVATLGDLDGDGWPELLISAPWANGQRGMNYVYSTRVLPPSQICAGEPNSTGVPAELSYRKSISLAQNNFRLRITNGPVSELALILCSTEAALVPFGDGNLCLGGNLLRATLPNSLNASGAKLFPLDFSASPMDLITAGQSYLFQGWYRDQGSFAGFNMTSALRVVFCP